MKEISLIKTIQNTINSDLIGDDCALLKDLGVVITQDNLVEDVHFKLDFTTPYQLGYKSAMVNISDICASGAEPKYLTVGLSLPNYVDENFVKEFYEGLKQASGDLKIAGGDITGSDKIFISITAIGSTKGRNISSRKNAKIGQKVVISGEHGSSGAGLKMLLNNIYEPKKFIQAHLMPTAEVEFSKKIALTQKNPYAMMDTSDGLMDALVKIADSSGVLIEIDFDKIQYDKDLEKFSDWKKLLFYGGEDYKLVATVDDNLGFAEVGEVKNSDVAGVKINYRDYSEFFTSEDVKKNIYNHFKE